MSRTYFGIQTTLVLVLTALVSWPEFRPVRAAANWRVPTERVRTPAERAIPSTAAPESQNSGYTSRPAMALPPTDLADGFVAPEAVAALGARRNVMVGRAQTTLNVPLPFSTLILRDLRTGRVASRTTADQEGRYQFADVTPGAYVVELVGREGGVVGLSDLLAVANGDVRDATVRISPGSAGIAAAFGDTMAGSLSDAVNYAAANDVTRTPAPANLNAVTPEQ